jgi:type I restriction enzyme S subunit
VRGLNSNAAQPGLSQRKLREMPVVIAPADLADRFEVAAQPMLSEALDLSNTMRHLAQLRDLLLPKLVTGQIDVSHLDLDALTGEATA